MHIDYYFSTFSSYTYLAGTRFEDVVRKHGATVSYKPVDILKVFSETGGLPPKQRHSGRQEYRMQEIRRFSKKYDLVFNFQPIFGQADQFPSSSAIINAQAAGGGDLGVLVHSVLRALWAEDKDIEQESVVRACLKEAGFDPSLAAKNQDENRKTYDANSEEAISKGVFGAPFYIVTETDERFFGQDRISDLDFYLASL